ncbi:melanocortin-2 receptor accessory protein 2 isoform X3 [Hyperolius riggenbachi]|uniref:melanocortin-2 receptor accessory protein 2 isoform X3 n=1 Tax=Hyperolius riggenbachi TaxID=752182 RepID=UPI0035A3AE2B
MCPGTPTPLKPGRSLMDWIRLKSSGKDLTGLGGRLIEVTEEELAKHNQQSDCWTCIRGLVYNITPYMEYHPGGVEELMKAAGVDGTQLFDEVHRWVNYESMLKECLVGRMALKHALILKGGIAVGKNKSHQVNGTESNSQRLCEDKPLHPRYEWFQTDATVTVVVYTKQKNVDLNMVTVDCQENNLRVEIIIEEYSYLLLIELSYSIQNIQVHALGKTGKVELVLQKNDYTVWKSLGQLLEGNDSCVKRSQRELYYRKCRLTSKINVNHNTKLLCFELPQYCHLQVPVGHHVYLKQIISGVEVAKPYTPVFQTLMADLLKPSYTNEQNIYLMIKIYPGGSFTPLIDSMAIGDDILVSNPQGCFRPSQADGIEDIFLLAAGTGFTPFAKLLTCILNSSPKLNRKVKLIFFNKTEDDILWWDQLKKLSSADKRFEAQFIVSEPSTSWNGCIGSISTPLLSQSIQRSRKDATVLICICGPTGFVDQGVRADMSEHSVNVSKTSHKQPSSAEYTWEYEYYDYAPVSFEGLKAHKYSIVIGFWVGLAVFVMFMFFVLTLLTKTGAPHQENLEPSEKRFRMNSFVADFGRPTEADRIFSPRGVEENRSVFHCYINEADHSARTTMVRTADSDVLIQQTVRNCKVEEDPSSLAKFNIPNFISTEQNSSSDDNDLLIYDPPIILENNPACSRQHSFIN